MIDLTDIGLEPEEADATLEAAAAPEQEEAPKSDLVAGSVLARALYNVWTGQPCTVIDSPPGAGKTTLVLDIVAQLKQRSKLKVVLATPTKRGAYDLAERIAARLGPDSKGRPQVALSVYQMTPPPGVANGGRDSELTNIPVVRTIASCKRSAPACDLMIVDEAYQATFADVTGAADNAKQVLMVGDPGQIGPVVTADVSAFRGRDAATHMRAPEVYTQRSYTQVLAMDTTYRLGQQTVDAIAPLYNFDFSSSRPDRHVERSDGKRLRELRPMEIPVSPTIESLDTMVRVAEAAAKMVGRTLVETDTDGTEYRRPLEQSDVAVVVAHNAQSSTITAILRDMKMPNITVGTADKMQGGQWHAVIALDPFTGHSTASGHRLSPGRLCVMASRHLTHLSWLFSDNWEEMLNDPDVDKHEAKLARTVRRALTGTV
ncbi:hypothetical protein D477_003133 [Arthrobacter crystallopoietes BAB-32]|uniref:Uncharacterized protein n=1 Tax=Arthrobacter crystallopoietes BAB-32 TaxID=1246476 RepID=N1V2T1_9MICC|nr:AAA family ATPase [Arthrobacter crystallopoietes]EMY35655.1 hypothetical protein D477_003133 [Arthrobacter crystallopoietes BAB-32]